MPDKWIAEFEKVGKKLNSRIAEIMKQLDTVKRGGRLIVDPLSKSNIEFAAASRQSFIDLLNESGYKDVATAFVKSTPAYINNIKATSDVAMSFTRADRSILTALNNSDFTKLLQVEGEIGDKLSNILFAGTSGGESFSTLTKQLAKSAITTQARAKTYVTTARSTILQKTEDLSAQNYAGVLRWFYQGPSDNKNRPECLIGTGQVFDSRFPNAPYFTNDEKELFQSTFGIRWNCRHTFHQVTEEEYIENVGENLNKR